MSYFKRIVSVCFSILFLATLNAYAENTSLDDADEIVVTATAVPTSISKIGSSVTIITAEEIEEKNPATVMEVLQSVPNLSVTSTGYNVTSIGLRGGHSNYTMIMVDGIPISDPATTNGVPNLDTLSPNNIERIEIVSGPASALYGSGALSGVINIITKKGEKGKSSNLALTAGSYGSLDFAGEMNHVTDITSLYIGAKYFKDDGISSKKGDDEVDPFHLAAFSVKFGLTPHKMISNTAKLDYSHTKADYDGFLDRDAYSEFDSLLLADTIDFRPFDLWQVLLNLSHYELKHSTTENNPSAGPFDAPKVAYDYEGTKELAELKNNFFLHEMVKLTVGGVWNEEKSDHNLSTAVEGYSFVDFSPISMWSLFAGGRYTKPNDYDASTTYSVSTSFNIEQIGFRLKGALGTGYKTPSLYQRYGIFGGNKNLKAEKSNSWEVGFEQSLFDKRLIFGATYFDSKYDNAIIYVMDAYFNGEFKNAQELKVKGVETFVSVYPIDILSFEAGYVYSEANQYDDGVKVTALKRPKNKFHAFLSVYPIDDLTVAFEVIHVSKTFDYGNTQISPYTLYNMYGNYKLMDSLTLDAKILNIFSANYETSKGYNNKGVQFYAGAKYTF